MEEQEEVSQIVSEEGNMTDVQDDLVKNDDSKVDFLERVKGLFGFGSYLKVQQIGFVFFIPIPSSWAFKTQVVVTQFITIVYSIAIYLVFQHVSQSVVENIINDWQSNIFDEHLFTLMDHVRWNYDELITESLELSNIYSEIINTQKDTDLMKQTVQIIIEQMDHPDIVVEWPMKKRFHMNQSIDSLYEGQVVPNAPYQQRTFEFSTFMVEQRLNQSILEYLLNINYVLPFQYQSSVQLGEQYFWYIDDQVQMAYPGITMNNSMVDILQQANKKIRDQFKDGNITYLPFQMNQFFNTSVAYMATDIVYKNNNIGMCYCIISIERLEKMFLKLTNLSLNRAEFKIIILDMDDNIYNGELRGRHVVDSGILDMSSESIKDMSQFVPSANMTYKSYWTQNNRTLYSVTSLIRVDLGLKLYCLLNNQMSLDQNAQMKKDYRAIIEHYNNTEIPVFVVIPMIMMIVCIIQLVKWMKPIDQIIQLAYLSIKKNQKLNQEELEEIQQEGLIKQLILLFKQMIAELNELKNDNKRQLSEHYSQQSYPQNYKVIDMTQLREQVELIREMEDKNAIINNPQRYMKLIPQHEE